MAKVTRNGHISIFLISLFMLLVSIESLLTADSLIQQISARRIENGGIVIFGKSILPKGTILMIDISRPGRLLGQTKVTVNEQGNFSSEPFTDNNKPHPSGLYKVTITSYFTKIWQSDDVLNKTGESGNKLPSALLLPDDPEFPKAGGHLEVSFDLTFPGVSPELQAIQAVKDARLTLPDKGRSADPIKDVIAYFEKAGGFTAIGWSANQSLNGLWIVTLNCIDAGKRKQAQWEFNPKNKIVKYLDPLAKLLSWLPSE